jgi:hypothetical protein
MLKYSRPFHVRSETITFDHYFDRGAAVEELPVPPATDRRVWAHVDAATLRPITARAAADLDRPWPVPLARDYARYFRDGDRETYEQIDLTVKEQQR